MFVFLCICICVFVYLCICVFVYLCICICVFVFVYLYKVLARPVQPVGRVQAEAIQLWGGGGADQQSSGTATLQVCDTLAKMDFSYLCVFRFFVFVKDYTNLSVWLLLDLQPTDSGTQSATN